MIVDVCPYELAGLHSSFLIPEQINCRRAAFAPERFCTCGCVVGWPETKLLNFYIFQASEHDLGGSESYQPA